MLGSAVSGKPETFGEDQDVSIGSGQSREVGIGADKTSALHETEVLTFVEFKLLHHSPSDPVSEPSLLANGLSRTALYTGGSVPATTGPSSKTRRLNSMSGAPDTEGRTWQVVVKLSNPGKSRLSEIEAFTNVRNHATGDMDCELFLKEPPLITRREGCVQMARFGSYETRASRTMVVEQLFQITELVDAASAAPVYRNIVKCYQRLYEECGILHSDISTNNLMYREEGGGIHGRLNDFDLARCNPPKDPRSRQRTGTKQFMAYDLLDPRESHPHFYRHDLESIFYVMIFHLCGYDQGKETSFSLWDWPELASEALWDKKIAFFSREVPSTTKHFAPLAVWLHRLADMFHQGFTTRTRNRRFASIGEMKPFKEETLDDHVTFNTFNKIISENGI